MNYSESQEKAIELIKKGKNIFLTGEAGNGKSYLLKSLKTLFPEKCIVLTATTGVAAFNLGGSTIHSVLCLGIGDFEADTIVRKMSIGIITVIKNIDILVIDEISMMNSSLFEKINRILKNITGYNKFMGGKQIIVSGDFFQLPNITGTIIFESKYWKKLTPVILKTNFRQNGDDKYLELLKRIRVGNILQEDIDLLNSKICEKKDEHFSIFPTNSQVRIVNEFHYDNINSPEYVFKTNYSGDEYILKDLKKQFFENNLETIKLKIGCRVMLIRNINTNCGLVNGASGIVKKLLNGSALVQFDHLKTLVSISKEEWKVEIGSKKSSATQIPLIVSYAGSIHKSQGLTLTNAYMDLSKCFCNHQVYVALSRVKTLDGLSLNNFDPKKITVNKKVVDYYKELENM